MLERVGQTVLTCPPRPVSTACPRRPSESSSADSLRYFGDRYQSSKFLDGQRYWRIPVMEGEFLVQETFGVQKAIGGGNFLILARDQDAALAAAEAAVDVMRKVRGVILPFPGGIVRAGSKVGAKRYKKMIASTNDAYCPTLRGRAGVDERAARGRELGAGDRGGRPGPSRDRERPARGDRCRLSSRCRRDLGRQLRRQAREAPLPPAFAPLGGFRVSGHRLVFRLRD